MRGLTKKDVRAFQKVVYTHHASHQRAFPWRTTHDPYHVLVSEMMLQQTQADRVTAKYAQFLRRFPDVSVLAQAKLGEVLVLWQGLGYNRRAKALWETAQVIQRDHKSIIPSNAEKLRALPGIGVYTASAILVFAFNKPTVVVETNIRTVYIHHFFGRRSEVRDRELLPVIEQTLDSAQPRIWYSALMDYGSYLKRVVGNLSQKSRHYVRQSGFRGSDREIRGRIIKTLAEHKQADRRALLASAQGDRQRLAGQLAALVKEGMIQKQRGFYALP